MGYRGLRDQPDLTVATPSASGTTPLVVTAAGAAITIPSRDRAGQLLTVALACVADVLDPPVGRAVLAPGSAVAWDDCCDGQVWVRLISLVPKPDPTGLSTPCGPSIWVATLGIGVVRCVATVDDQGYAPPASALITDTLQMTADMTALSEAIQCCLAPQTGKTSMLRWEPSGPEGGCAGGEWTITVLIDNCGCP